MVWYQLYTYIQHYQVPGICEYVRTYPVHGTAVPHDLVNDVVFEGILVRVSCNTDESTPWW